MLFQFLVEFLFKSLAITDRRVGLYVVGLSHSGNYRADGFVHSDKPQGHFGHRHPLGDQWP